MNPNGEPIPGATPPEAGQPEPSNLDRAILDAHANNPLTNSGALEKLLGGLPEGSKIDPEALRRSKEKVARYVEAKTTGIDNQPLPDEAADSAMESIRLERTKMIRDILGKTASGEEVDRAIAIDTLLLSQIVDQYDAYKRDMGEVEGDNSGKISDTLLRLHADNPLTNTGAFEKVFKDLPRPELNISGRDQAAEDTTAEQDKIKAELDQAVNPYSSLDNAHQAPPASDQPTA